MSRRFLFFLYFLPPAPGTAPKRNKRILKALAADSAYAIVFTAQYPGKHPETIPGAEIKTIKALDYRTWLRRKTADGYLAETSKKQGWKQFGIRMINSFPFSILLGEGGLFYFFSLLRKGQQTVDEHKITHLYSSFRPFADHYAAYWIKKRNPAVCWIADFRDVIVDPHYGHILWPKAHQRFFKNIFQKADIITTVSEGLAKNLRQYGDKVITVRNGIEHSLDEVTPVTTSKFTLVYTGSMMLDTRNPRPVFMALKGLMDLGKIDTGLVQLIYAGKDGNQWETLAAEYHMTQQLINNGIMEGDQARRLQHEACINLLLTTSSPELSGVLTGKLIEYIEAGSPILALVKGIVDPELKSIIYNANLGKCFLDTDDPSGDMAAFILDEYIKWKNTGLNRKPANLDWIKRTLDISAVMAPLMNRLHAHDAKANSMQADKL